MDSLFSANLTFLGQSPGNPKLVDLAQACRERTDGIRTSIPESTRIAVDLPEPGPVVRADPFQIKQLVDAAGGCITVDSVPSRGSTFRVFLPLSSRTVSTSETAGRVGEQTVVQGGTVLLVEDQEMVQKMTRIMLNRIGFDVISARDGTEAVDIFRRRAEDIRLVLTDLALPGLNGWQILAAVRRIRPGIPVILASGYDQASVMAESEEDQPQVFLSKPYGKVPFSAFSA